MAEGFLSIYKDQHWNNQKGMPWKKRLFRGDTKGYVDTQADIIDEQKWWIWQEMKNPNN